MVLPSPLPKGVAPSAGVVVPGAAPSEAPLLLITPSAGVGEEQRLRSARERAATFEVEIQKKYAIAAACLVFALVGAPVALRFQRGGVGLVLGVSVAVFTVYYVGLIGGEELGNRLMVSPVFAMWTPNLVCTIAGLARGPGRGAVRRGVHGGLLGSALGADGREGLGDLVSPGGAAAAHRLARGGAPGPGADGTRPRDVGAARGALGREADPLDRVALQLRVPGGRRLGVRHPLPRDRVARTAGPDPGARRQEGGP